MPQVPRSSHDQAVGEHTWPRRIVLGAAAAVAVASALSAGYLAYADRRDQSRFPSPGELVDVPGHGRRHLWRHGPGTGTPIVVVACLGGSVTGWADLAPRLAEHGPVLLYDRDGIGWSPATRRWSTSLAQEMDELEAVLVASGLDGPYVLVGHSTGGIVSRHFAARHPDQVAALVMVDSSHENMTDRLAAADPPPWWRWWEPRWGSAVAERLKPVGLRRLAHDLGWLPSGRASSAQFNADEYLDAHIAHSLGASSRWGGTSELAGLDNSLRRTSLAELGDTPLIVITGGPGTYPQRQRWYPEWQKLQAEIAATSTRSQQIVAPDAGHHVHRDEPDLVVDAILAAQSDAATRG